MCLAERGKANGKAFGDDLKARFFRMGSSSWRGGLWVEATVEREFKQPFKRE
jgi:hypothetical protein